MATKAGFLSVAQNWKTSPKDLIMEKFGLNEIHLPDLQAMIGRGIVAIFWIASKAVLTQFPRSSQPNAQLPLLTWVILLCCLAEKSAGIPKLKKSSATTPQQEWSHAQCVPHGIFKGHSDFFKSIADFAKCMYKSRIVRVMLNFSRKVVTNLSTLRSVTKLLYPHTAFNMSISWSARPGFSKSTPAG